MLTFCAIAPHPPLLIPQIGKDNLEKIKATEKALKNLEQDLYAAKPDAIIIISPHGVIIDDAFSINLNPRYKVNFEEFGDFQTKLEFASAPNLCLKIKERVENDLPIILTSDENLDHGAGVPLLYLTKHLPDIEIVPVGYSLLDYKKHFQFGQLLKKEIAKSDKRIAVIASGDLSHALSKSAPAGYKPQGPEFDKTLVNLLKRGAFNEILRLDHKLVENASECGFRSILILLGILDEYKCQPQILSYEGPFGVGYLVADFKLM